APEAGLHFAADRISFETLADLAALVPYPRALGEDEWRIGESLDGPAHYFLRVPEAIDGGSIDPVDALVERGADGGDGFVVILRPPGEGPSATAHSPCANPNRREAQVTVAELFGFHLRPGGDYRLYRRKGQGSYSPSFPARARRRSSPASSTAKAAASVSE